MRRLIVKFLDRIIDMLMMVIDKLEDAECSRCGIPLAPDETERMMCGTCANARDEGIMCGTFAAYRMEVGEPIYRGQPVVQGEDGKARRPRKGEAERVVGYVDQDAKPGHVLEFESSGMGYRKKLDAYLEGGNLVIENMPSSGTLLPESISIPFVADDIIEHEVTHPNGRDLVVIRHADTPLHLEACQHCRAEMRAEAETQS